MRARLQRLLAAAGLCSRREAEQWIAAGRVQVNGARASLGDGADPDTDTILVDGHRIGSERLVYWMAHKPRGVLSARRDPEGRATVLGLLPPGLPRVVPVGRLDSDTEGLVLLTNDGPLVHRLLHPSLGNEREYRVVAKGLLPTAALRRLAEGMHLDDGPTAPARVRGVRYERERDRTQFDLVMIEGRKRQIRRMLSMLRHPVVSLLRTRMGPIRLGALRPGEARALDAGEIERLRAHVGALRPRPPSRAGRERPAPRPGRAGPRR